MQNITQYLSVCQSIQIMLCILLNTSPEERQYTYVKMVATKNRNQLGTDTLEILFLLAVLKLPVKKLDYYDKEIEFVEDRN